MNKKIINPLFIFILVFFITFGIFKFYSYLFLTQTSLNIDVNGIARLEGKTNPFSGTYRHFYSNSFKISEKGYFKNGIKTGKFTTYFQNGEINTLSNYSSGLLNGEFLQYDDKGILKSKIIYKSGKKEGKAEYFFNNGKIQSIENYKNDDLNGVKKDYYDNGKLNREKTYSGGLLNGIEKIYSREGILLQDTIYKDNKLVKSKIYFDNGKLYREIEMGGDGININVIKEYDKNGKIIFDNTPEIVNIINSTGSENIENSLTGTIQ